MKKIKAFGFDIGATAMRAVWLSTGDSGYFLNSVYASATPPKGMISESPMDQAEMAQAILHVVNEAKITTRYVNIALPENQVYTKVIEMPVLSDKELASAIYWEAEQYIPVPLQNVTFDYKVLQRPNPGEENLKMYVLLVGAPTVLIDKYQKILSMAGLTVLTIETEILSTIRSLTYSPIKDLSQKSPPTFIINIGALSTTLTIVKDEIIVFTYAISLGGAAISRAIAADFGFSLSQAEEYKKTYGVSKEILQGKIGKASEPILTSIMTEVKKALAYYGEKHKEEPIGQIILSGGSARLPGINVFFAEKSGIETAIANPWKVLSGQQLPKDLTDNASEYSVAVGLAMRDYE